MAEWLFDLLAEAACSVLIESDHDDDPAYAILGAIELSLQANLSAPLGLKDSSGKTAELLRECLHIPPGTVVTVEPAIADRYDA